MLIEISSQPHQNMSNDIMSEIDISFTSPLLIDSLFSKIIWKHDEKYLNSYDGAVGGLEE